MLPTSYFYKSILTEEAKSSPRLTIASYLLDIPQSGIDVLISFLAKIINK